MSVSRGRAGFVLTAAVAVSVARFVLGPWSTASLTLLAGLLLMASLILRRAALLELRRRRLERGRHAGRPTLSISRLLVGAAIRRLPEQMPEAEKERWAAEINGDMASIDGWLRRLVYAFGVWRRGAPAMPSGGDSTPRSASD